MIRFFPLVALALVAGVSFAAETLPPRPSEYVTDRAGILSARTIAEWNTRLADYERETSNQVLAEIFPSVPEGCVMEDFTNRTFDAWGVGQKKTNNGAVLFIFSNDHQMRIEVGYGLEGALPDATAKTILDNEVRPAFRSGNFDAGVSQGLEAILAATRGEYRGRGRTQADNDVEIPFGAVCFLIIVIGFVMFGFFAKASRQSKVYGRRGRGRGRSIWGWSSGSDWSWGGSSGGGWSSGGSDGGGFSGGGGSSGGGGASGSW